MIAVAYESKTFDGSEAIGGKSGYFLARLLARMGKAFVPPGSIVGIVYNTLSCLFRI
jgi:hypothetical protein